MLTPGTILRLLDRETLLRLLLFALLYSIVPLAETALLIYLGNRAGNYLILALAASTGFVGVFVAFGELRAILSRIRNEVRESRFPGDEFVNIAGVLAGALFLLTPGFITDTLGLMLFLPVLRRGFGRMVIRLLAVDLREIYEYLQLSGLP